MPIVLVRIDERLIHGQVIVGWAASLEVGMIIVADDEIARNAFRWEVMKIAVPPNMSVEAYDVSRTVEKYLHHDFDFPDKNIILLFSGVNDFKKSLDLGFTIEEVNLGCIHSGENQILSNIAIKKEEAFCLEEIQSKGVHVEVRALPGDEKIDLHNISMYQKLIEEK